MTMSVKARAENLATFRYLQVYLMELIARWVPTTPEMEVKLLFGTHIWDAAQHADALGNRVHELRMPKHHTLVPADAYTAILTEWSAIEVTAQRIDCIYELFLPSLAQRYRDYLSNTDVLMDAPSVRIIDRILFDHERIGRECMDLRQKLPTFAAADAAWVKSKRAQEAFVIDIVQHQPVSPANRTVA